MRRRPHPPRRLLALLLVPASFGMLAACGGDGTSGFAQGRACRIGERLVAAVAAGDASTAADEVDRLDDLDDTGAHFDVAEIDGTAEAADPQDVDELIDLLDDGGCDIDEPGSMSPPTATTEPADTAVTTETTDDTIPDFTLPIPPETSAPAPPTSGQPPATTTAPPGATEMIEVDVGATESDRLPAGRYAGTADLVTEYEMGAMVVPKGPLAITGSYVRRDLAFGGADDSIDTVVHTEVPLERISARFRTAVARTGDYRFAPVDGPREDNRFGFNAQPRADGPSWTVEIRRSDAGSGLVEVSVSRFYFGDDVTRTIPPVIRRALDPQLARLESLDWPLGAVSEFRTDLDDFSTTTVSLNATVASSAPRPLADLLAGIVEGATVEQDDEVIRVHTPEGDWQLSELGDGEVGDGEVFVYFASTR